MHRNARKAFSKKVIFDQNFMIFGPGSRAGQQEARGPAGRRVWSTTVWRLRAKGFSLGKAVSRLGAVSRRPEKWKTSKEMKPYLYNAVSCLLTCPYMHKNRSGTFLEESFWTKNFENFWFFERLWIFAEIFANTIGIFENLENLLQTFEIPRSFSN